MGRLSEDNEVNITKLDNTGINIFFLDLAPRASGKFAAVRSLEIAEHDQFHWRIRVAFELTGLLEHHIDQRGFRF